MNETFDKTTSAIVLAQVALHNPHNLHFAAQLLGWPVCNGCDYVQKHCKCAVKGEAS